MNDLERRSIHENCKGCNKIENNLCSVYINPTRWWTNKTCPLHSDKVIEVKKGKKVNPIKASKRG